MAVSIVFASPALAHSQNVHFVCPSINSNTGKLQVRIDSGCKSSSSRYVGHDLRLSIDQNTAQIHVDGGLEFSYPTLVGATDCGGAREVTLEAETIEPRRYRVFLQNQYLGVSDLLEAAGAPNCLDTTSLQGLRPVASLNRIQFADWDPEAALGWTDWRGEDPFELLSPILANHPTSLKGSPTVSINMERYQWRDRISSWSDSFLGVWITRHGLLDDSISGDKYFAAAVRDGDGWKLTDLWGQHMCARGSKAGQWTKETCS
jgi:hypothetical protein